MTEELSLIDRLLLMKADVDKAKLLGRKITKDESLYYKVKNEKPIDEVVQ